MFKFEPSSRELVIRFASREAARHFKSWLCEAGEQDYWQWMEMREQEDASRHITGIEFDYFKGSLIPVKCGRLG